MILGEFLAYLDTGAHINRSRNGHVARDSCVTDFGPRRPIANELVGLEEKLPTTSVRSGHKLRFGEFELDTRAGELRRNGREIHLQEQTLRLLSLLLERRGEIVLREDIRRRLWPNDTVVEVSHGINAAVQRLREALKETAEDPRYVETIARRGYRFRANPGSGPSEVAGRTVGRFRVLERLGSGGMGLVYRAEDLRLGREVALKLLTPELARDRTAVGRFEREARAASALNHPHVCTIYSVEDHGGQPMIVMEFVQGPTLEAALREGPLPASRVLVYAGQIAGALEAAHRKGVIHRDLKPGNIVIGELGVKVLDFGLARIACDGAVTKDGAIVGTPDYMSPEQIRGDDVDVRTDIFSFGVVLHEMLTGRRPGGPGAAIPTALGRVAERCLRSRPEERWQSASELLAALETAGNASVRWGRREWITAAAVGAAAALPLAWNSAADLFQRKPERSALRHAGSEMLRLSLSPNGRQLAYFAGGRLFVRSLDGTEPRALEGVRGVGTPFWSPDSRRLGLAANGKLWTIDLRTGTAKAIADVNTNLNGCWGPAGSILIGLVGDGLSRIRESGGPLNRVTTLDSASDETRHLGPQLLPVDQRYLFTAGASKPGASVLWAGSLDAARRVAIEAVETAPVFVPGGRDTPRGHLLFGRQNSLLAMPFDARRLSATGTEFVVADGVVTRAAVGAALRVMEYSAAGDTVVYRPASSDAAVMVRHWTARRA